MDDLTAFLDFLDARLDERAEAAEAMQSVYPTPWDLADRGAMAHVVADAPLFLDVVRIEQEQAPHLSYLGDVIRHVCLQAPDAVLADVAAKRQIIDLHGLIHREIGWHDDDNDEVYDEIPVCVLCVPKHSHFLRREDVPEGWCATVRLLALPYSDHPDYRESWRP